MLSPNRTIHCLRLSVRSFAFCITLLVSVVGVQLIAEQPAFAIQRKKTSSLTAQDVRESIQRGVQFLLRRADLNSGSFGKLQSPEDITALCVLALLNAEVPPSNPTLQKSLSLIESVPRDQLSTYFVSLRIMALATADPTGTRYLRKISGDTQWLVERQIPKGINAGGWDYHSVPRTADASNSQFALLALHEAAKLGIEVPQETWSLAARYWDGVSTKDGGFRYRTGGGGASGSMTCAGISSWIIIQENLADEKGAVNGDRAACCGNDKRLDRVEQAIEWLANKFRVRSNPGQGHSGSQLYYLYGMERAGRLAGRRFFGAHDWYREGAEELLRKQNRMAGSWKGMQAESNEQIATSLALLFLSKGKRPIAIGKAAWSEDDRWNRHPKGVHYLTRRLEKEWNQRLNWQTVRTKDASTDDLLEAPVLFLSGREALELSEKEKETLKAYLENGGFLFAEACQGEGCGDAAFDSAFRALIAELLPDGNLEPLPPDHPIWGAYYPLFPDEERPLLAMQSCCRTSVIYCPANLSCYWSLDRPAITPNPRLKKRIESCIQIGVNVVTYATGKELQDKGETPKLASAADSVLAGRSLELPKLAHGGGSDDAPNAWRNVLREVGDAVGLRIEPDKKVISPTLEELAEHPFVFMHGRASFKFTDKEREALKTYLEVGGFIFADSICSSTPFTESFRKEMKLITGQTLQPIDPSHPIWTDQRFGYRIDQVTLQKRDPRAEGGFRREKRPPELESIEIDDQVRVIFSPNDLSCAMENTAFSQCDGYTRAGASRIAINVILYRLLSD